MKSESVKPVYRSEELVEPQSSALAKLCAYCVFAASIPQGNSSVNFRKRSRRQMEAEVSNRLNYGLMKEKVNNATIMEVNIYDITI